MKKLILLAFLIPCIAKAQFKLSNTSNVTLLELRSGEWPFTLSRTIKDKDTVYLILFRDRQYPKQTNMSTLKLGNKDQLRYFQQGLSALKELGTGETAEYKDYKIKRMDVKQDVKTADVWYTLTLPQGDVTDLKQAEVDKIIAYVKAM